MKITASVVLYNTAASVYQNMLASVRNSSIKVQLYVVDNSKSPCLTREQQALVDYHHQSSNLGYGAGHNVAMRMAMDAGSDYHFVLNPDIWFSSDVLKKIVDYMNEDLSIGYVLPLVCSTDGVPQRLCKLLPTPMNLLVRRFPFPFFRTIFDRINDRYELRFWNQDTVEDIPILSGCFMALSVQAIEKVGLFDENYFMYLEDYDLIRRIGERYRTVFFPSVSIVHAHGKESFKTFRMMRIHVVSAIRYFNKWGWFIDRYRNKTNRRTLANLLGRSHPDLGLERKE